MARTIKVKIGADAVLRVEFELRADDILKEDIVRLTQTISKGEKDKRFSVGDVQSGRIEANKKLGGSWQAKGVDGQIEGQKFTLDKSWGETLEIDDVAYEMARQLAFLTADVEDISSRIERKFGIDIDKDELAKLISADITLTNMRRDFSPDA